MNPQLFQQKLQLEDVRLGSRDSALGAVTGPLGKRPDPALALSGPVSPLQHGADGNMGFLTSLRRREWQTHEQDEEAAVLKHDHGLSSTSP